MQWTTWAWERANGDCKSIFLTLFYASLLISLPHSVTITCHVLQRYCCSWMSANSLQSWPTLEWVTILSSRGSSWPRDGTQVSRKTPLLEDSLYLPADIHIPGLLSINMCVYSHIQPHVPISGFLQNWNHYIQHYVNFWFKNSMNIF